MANPSTDAGGGNPVAAAKNHFVKVGGKRQPPPQPVPTACAHYLPKKRRFCGFPLREGSRYCTHHNTCDTGPNKRVPCPVDPRHTVYARDLAAHVARCQETRLREKEAAKPFYRKGVNAGVHAGTIAAPPPPPPVLAEPDAPATSALPVL